MELVEIRDGVLVMVKIMRFSRIMHRFARYWVFVESGGGGFWFSGDFFVTFQGLILKIVAYEKDDGVLVGVRVGGVW